MIALAAAGITVGGALGATPTIADETQAASTDDETAPPWSPDHPETIPEGDITARMIDERVSREEAVRRFDVERATSALQREAAARWPDTFAGTWIDVEPYRVAVAFTRDADANVADLAHEFDHPEDLLPITAPLSYTSLTALKQRIIGDRTALRGGRPPAHLPGAIRATQGVYDLGIDVRSTRIAVRVQENTDALRQAFRDTYTQAITVTEGVSEPRTCFINNCSWTMMGGLRIAAPTGGWCSTAFTGVANGHRHVLSAAHCKKPNRQHAGNYYGFVDKQKFGGALDAERIRKDSAFRESSKFMVDGEDPRMVSAFKKYADMVVGTYVGKTGARTQTTRGYVTDIDVSPSYVPSGWGFVEADMCSDNGDSGAAIFRGTTAWGILSGGYTGACRGGTGSSTDGPTYFGAIGRALHHLGGLLHGVNLAPIADYDHSCGALLNCTFNGGPSDDPDGSITTYRWDFSDGTTKFGMVVSKTFDLPGNYTAKLTVTDNNGKKHSKSKSFTVL